MNYYNEFDPKAAAWLRELIKEGVIPDGIVDERSITDVRADELRGFTQCHFFAGVGGWPFALRLAGIPDDFPCWTGSCPCQPFSNAGEQKGTEDERDLWPVFTRLITACKPEYVFGEQVASAIKFGWIDRVHADLEKEGYACGEVVLGAHSVGAPHIRQRLYWGAARMALSESCGYGEREHRDKTGTESEVDSIRQEKGLRISDSSDASGNVRLSNSNSERCNGQSIPDEWRPEMPETARSCTPCRVGNTESDNEQRNTVSGVDGQWSEDRGSGGSGLPNFSPWSDFGFVLCRDTDKQGRHRVRRVPAESLLLCMADGLPEDLDRMRYQSILEHPERAFPLCSKEAVPGRAMLLKGFGNAIVPELAAEFIKSFLTEVNCGQN